MGLGCGGTDAQGGNKRPSSGAEARSSDAFDVFWDYADSRSSKSSETAQLNGRDPDEYIFGLQAVDWFGNTHLYLKKNEQPLIDPGTPPIELRSAMTWTNGSVKLLWNLPEALPGEMGAGWSVAVTRDASAHEGPPTIVGFTALTETQFLDRVAFVGPTTVVYRAGLYNGGDLMGRSSPLLYEHPGVHLPLPGRVERVETNRVGGFYELALHPRPTPYVTNRAWSVMVSYDGGFPVYDSRLRHTRRLPLRVEHVFRSHDRCRVRVVEEAAIRQGADGTFHYLPGEPSDWVALRMPVIYRQDPVVNARKRDRDVTLDIVRFPAGATQMVVTVDGAAQTFTVATSRVVETDSMESSGWRFATHFRDGFVATSAVARVESTPSGDPVLLRMEREADGRSVLVCSLGYRAGTATRAAVTVNGVRRHLWNGPFEAAELRSPPMALVPGDVVQFFCVTPQAVSTSPSYRIEPPATGTTETKEAEHVE